MDPPTPSPRRRGARIYSRPRFGFKPTRRLILPVVASLASLAFTIWWAFHHAHR